MPLLEAIAIPKLEPLKVGGSGPLQLAIIGGGPAGLTAAIYAGRSNIPTLIFEQGAIGGQAALTDRVENYPGFPGGISGLELAEKMEMQAKELGAMITYEKVEAVSVNNQTLNIKTGNTTYPPKAVIVASGLTRCNRISSWAT